jgi:hypothetical protein
MSDAEPQSHALHRILEHCARLSDEVHGGPTGALRLRQAVGDELARLLLNALAGDHRRVRLRAIS